MQGWQMLHLPTTDFVLVAFVPNTTVLGKKLTVYIEGDGLAWITPALASDDPTPRQAMGLELALQHSTSNAAYLARPCQFVSGAARRGCEVGYWTGQRFSPQVIAASSQAIDALKLRFGAKQLILVGYSGGGAIAALVAARRSDVIRLVTVAGNLDHQAWTMQHQLAPLTGSLNPADAWQALQSIPQLHLIGGKDRNITLEVANAYRARFPSDLQPEVRVIPNFDHRCCWAQQWPSISEWAFPLN